MNSRLILCCTKLIKKLISQIETGYFETLYWHESFFMTQNNRRKHQWEQEVFPVRNFLFSGISFVWISRDRHAILSLKRKYGADIFPLTRLWPVGNYTPSVGVHAWVCDNMENSERCGGSVECSWLASPCYTHPLLANDVVCLCLCVCSITHVMSEETACLKSFETTAAFLPDEF